NKLKTGWKKRWSCIGSFSSPARVQNPGRAFVISDNLFSSDTVWRLLFLFLFQTIRMLFIKKNKKVFQCKPEITANLRKSRNRNIGSALFYTGKMDSGVKKESFKRNVFLPAQQLYAPNDIFQQVFVNKLFRHDPQSPKCHLIK